MKYSEFKTEVEKMGFVVEDEGTQIYVDKSKDGETLVSIGKHKQFWLDPGWSGFNNLTEDQQLKLYDLSYKLSKTPLTERENEKKYNVILPNILRDRKPILLCKSFDDHESCGIDWSPKDWLDDNMDRHIFTEQEIKDVDERYLAFKVEVTPE